MKMNTLKTAEMLAEAGWEMEKIETIGFCTRLQYTHPHIPGIAVVWEDNSKTHIFGDELVYVDVPGLDYMHIINLDKEVA
ncbi:MAG: hypothetical protein IIZ93_03070 [Acidaminococcaceae bacterium]|nr:hypothetical protein [Acidaminococcaceae bacterium]